MAVRLRGKIIYIDFYCYLPDGSKVRCVESTALKDTERNRKIAESKDKAILYELKHGQFNYLHFFPDGSKSKYFKTPVVDILFSDWWEEWISEKSLKPNTAKSWNSSYRCHIGPYFGHYPISQITEHELLVFRKIIEGKGLKANSINDKIWKPLCMALLTAYNRGIINKYPCQGVKKLDEDPVDINPLSFDELRHLLDVLKVKKPDYYDMIFIWSRIGLRPGEMYALKWKSLDYFNNKLMIRETRHANGLEDSPKTIHSVRDIDLRSSVIDAFKRQERRTGLMDSHIFMTQANRPFSDAFMRKKFRHLLRLAGLRYRPPVQMRHAFATLHIAAGENISWVSETLGHASVEITLKRYNRFVPNLTRKDGSAFEEIMEKNVQNGNNPVTNSGNKLISL